MVSAYVEQQTRLEECVAQPHEYPAGRFSGRGIVICAGGMRYFTNAWVCANILRMHGCKLPIQFWHLGPGEIDDEMRELVRPLGVECVDGYAVRQQYPARRLNGWELKPYAMLHSRFEEVICLDADNVALRDPEFLFETEQYKNTGAIFWPDYGRLAPTREIWKIMQVPYRDEPEFESGQAVVDKRRCWKALNVTMHLNEWSDFYYSHIHGDKETFHMAWRKLDQEYSMPSRGIHSLTGTMCQHDFDGNRIFQHRNMRKWTAQGNNERIRDFQFEAECLEFLSKLRDVWSVTPKHPSTHAYAAPLWNMLVQQRHYTYVRVGYDLRTIVLEEDGSVQAGPRAIEKRWLISGSPDNLKVLILDGDNVVMELKSIGGGMLSGAWVTHERMPVLLLPVPADTDQPEPRFHFRPGSWDNAIWQSVVRDNEYQFAPGSDARVPWAGDVVDIGGHIGSFSYLALTKLQARHVIVVEPDPENFALLQKNLRSFIADGRVTAINAGIGPENAKLALANKPGSNTGNALFAASDTGTVPTVSLQQLLNSLEGPVLLKLDCEGCEYSALVAETDLSRVPEIVGEFHELGGHRVEELRTLLTQRGYNFAMTRQEQGQGMFSASKPQVQA